MRRKPPPLIYHDTTFSFCGKNSKRGELLCETHSGKLIKYKTLSFILNIVDFPHARIVINLRICYWNNAYIHVYNLIPKIRIFYNLEVFSITYFPIDNPKNFIFYIMKKKTFKITTMKLFILRQLEILENMQNNGDAFHHKI